MNFLISSVCLMLSEPAIYLRRLVLWVWWIEGDPDHSLIEWYVDTGCCMCDSDNDTVRVSHTATGITQTRYDSSSIPLGFLADPSTMNELYATMSILEHSVKSQSDVDNAYTGLTNIIKQQMDTKLKL